MTPLRKKMIEEMQLRRFSANTQESYLRAVTELAKYYHKSPDSINTEQLKEYVLFLTNEKNLSWSSINTITAGIRFLFEQTLQRKDISLAIPPRKTPRRLPEIFGPGELIRLFDSVKNIKHRTILVTAYACGLRVSEVINLKVGDIDSSRMVVRVEHGKGDKDRYTILSPHLLKQLRLYWLKYRPTLWLFYSSRNKEKLSRATPQLVFKAAKKKAGITKNVTFHSLRHNFATNLLEAGVDIRTIQILMGHSCISSTSIYLHVARKDLGSVKSPLDLLYVPKPNSLIKS
ncbi:MAG: tyrosine-type recombinase/integrase [Candidatus Humimicrobiaceae bacterium]